MDINILYFASVRERLKVDSEKIGMAGDECRVSDVVKKLRIRGGQWEKIFGPEANVRFAVDQEFADVDAKVDDGSEVAVFPPVTGG